MTSGVHEVLVVEDDRTLRDAVCDLFVQEGISTTCAEDGQDALDLLRGGYRPCLIFLDVAMPYVDGMNFRRQQLESAEIAGIPVVIVTGHPRKEKEARRLGISLYVRKPVAPAQLLELLEHNCAHVSPAPLRSAG